MHPRLVCTLLLVALAPLFSASSCGRMTLDPMGAYKGDVVLFRVEDSTLRAHKMIDDFLKWETANQVTLAQWPQVKQFADHLRRDAKGWFTQINLARDTYLAAKIRLEQAKTDAEAAAAAANLDEKAREVSVKLAILNEALDITARLYMQYKTKTTTTTP